MDKLRLIIADDEKIIRDGLTSSVDYTKLGFSVDAVFEDGSQIIEYLKDNDADVVFTDVVMNNISGIEVAEWINAFRPHITVVLLTGYSDFEIARRAVECHVVKHIILKPTSLSEIKHVFSGIYGEYLMNHDSEDASIGVIMDKKETDDTFDLSEDKLAMRIIEWLKVHYFENISISDAARYVHLSPGYLNRYLKRHTKRNYSDLLKEIRLRASKKLLKETTLSVKIIAKQTGYPDASYFAHIFQESTGMTPTEFRRNT